MKKLESLGVQKMSSREMKNHSGGVLTGIHVLIAISAYLITTSNCLYFIDKK